MEILEGVENAEEAENRWQMRSKSNSKASLRYPKCVPKACQMRSQSIPDDSDLGDPRCVTKFWKIWLGKTWKKMKIPRSASRSERLIIYPAGVQTTDLWVGTHGKFKRPHLYQSINTPHCAPQGIPNTSMMSPKHPKCITNAPPDAHPILTT